MQKRSSNDANQIAASALADVTRAALRQALTDAATGPAPDEIPMLKRSSNETTHNDVHQTAAEVTQAAEDAPAKNPAAVALGRKGGLKGGKARAESLSAAKRARIARKAAKARWKKR